MIGRLRAWWVPFVLLGSVLALSSSPAAQEATAPPSSASQVESDARQLFREVMSPFCPGLTLADCPSPNAFTMRGEIEARLARGESRQAIVDELVATYGATILADPSETPIGAIVWGVPILLSVLAAAGLALFVRRATRPQDGELTAAVAGPPGLRDRQEEELDRLE